MRCSGGGRASAPPSALVGWVAELLLAAWQRQEAEGRYRGADDFRALHVDPADALASHAAIGRDQPWPASVPAGFPLAAGELPTGLGLSDAEALLAVLAVAVEHEPRLRPLVAALTDDPSLRLPTLGLALELAGGLGIDAADVREALRPDARLAALDVVRAVPVDGRPSLLDAALVASDWLIALGARPEPQGVTFLVGGAVPAGGHDVPVLLSGADHVSHAEHWGCGPVGLLRGPLDPQAVAAAARACRHRGAGFVIACDEAPQPWLVTAVEHLARLGCPVALSLTTGWISPGSWPVVPVARPDAAARASRWAQALTAAGGPPVDDAVQADLVCVAGEFTMGRDAIDDAARRVVVAGRVELPTLRHAARQAVWRDLSTCARRGPTGNTWDDLVVAPGVRTQLGDIAKAIGLRGRVLDDWGYGDRPGSRGYHVLFAGPSGTGKTMSAGVIAQVTGLELWVVDLARVVDKYLGETEKAIDKVLHAAENSGAMLLFDEADALFGRRGEVREAKDRWANVEVAFLLQRIEEHDGVTVLTTNVSHHLDEAFARRMSQRVEFGLPDAPLRRLLWRRSVPASAPLTDPGDLDTVADRFELAGGAIRSAALNAAYEAAADTGRIELGHLVRAGVRELTKAGRAPTRSDLGPLAALVTKGATW